MLKWKCYLKKTRKDLLDEMIVITLVCLSLEDSASSVTRGRKASR